MCNLYTMRSNVAEIIALFRVTSNAAGNLPLSDALYPGMPAPIVRTTSANRELAMAIWGFPPPTNAGSRPVTNVRNLASPFWRTALSRPDRRCRALTAAVSCR